MTLLDDARSASASDDAASPSVAAFRAADDDAHAAEVLSSHAYDGLPARMRPALVTHVLRTVCPEPDFAIRLAAMRAILGLAAEVDRGVVRVRSRPTSGALGAWGVSEQGTPYEVAVESLDPICAFRAIVITRIAAS